MKLTIEQVKTTLLEFADAYGTPAHLDSPEKVNRAVELYHRELSKHYNERTFSKGVSIAWTKCRRFPVVADFFQGYDGVKREEADLRGYEV